jgi:hypothetical protein
MQQVTQQGDNLHIVALAAAQVKAADMPDIAKTLVQDLEVGLGAPMLTALQSDAASQALDGLKQAHQVMQHMSITSCALMHRNTSMHVSSWCNWSTTSPLHVQAGS